MTVNSEVQKLEPDAIVSLYTLDTTPIGGSDIFRFTTMPDSAGIPLEYNNIVYTPIDIDASGFNWDGRGSFPKPKVRVSNVNNFVTAAIIELNDLVGSRFIRLRTFAKHLDNGSDPDPTAHFPLEIFVVDQKTKQNKMYVEWALASVIDQMGVEIPKRQCIRDSCTHRYRLWNPVTSTFDYTSATCPFVGANYFDEDNNPTTANNDKCNKKLTGCRARFGANGILPTRSFPGIARTRV